MADCITPAVLSDIARKDTQRLIGTIARALAANSPFINILGGGTFPSGVSDEVRTSVQMQAAPGDSLALNAGGNPDAVFVFQIGSTLTLTPGRQVILSGGAQAQNIFWQVGSSATLDTTSVLYGSILALTSISTNTGSVVHGRLLARNGAVTLDDTTVLCPPVV